MRAATRPHESGIPSNRVSPSRGEYVPAPCTHRPSLHRSWARARWRQVGVIEPWLGNGGEVVTRWPQGNLRPDHLLRKKFLALGGRRFAFCESRKEKARVNFPFFEGWQVRPCQSLRVGEKSKDADRDGGRLESKDVASFCSACDDRRAQVA